MLVLVLAVLVLVLLVVVLVALVTTSSHLRLGSLPVPKRSWDPVLVLLLLLVLLHWWFWWYRWFCCPPAVSSNWEAFQSLTGSSWDPASGAAARQEVHSVPGAALMLCPMDPITFYSTSTTVLFCRHTECVSERGGGRQEETLLSCSSRL